jgi:hypothetical protein
MVATIPPTGAGAVTTIPGIHVTDGVAITEVTTDGVIPLTDGVIPTTEDLTGQGTTTDITMATGTASITEADAMYCMAGWTAGITTVIPGPPM